MLKRIIYTSTANPDNTQKDIQDILDICQEKNTKMDVTGVLVFTGEAFIQILEGPDEAVTALLESISRDHRHSDVEVMTTKLTHERLFSKWSMGFVKPFENGEGLPIGNSYHEIYESLQNNPDSEDVLINACLNILRN